MALVPTMTWRGFSFSPSPNLEQPLTSQVLFKAESPLSAVVLRWARPARLCLPQCQSVGLWLAPNICGVFDSMRPSRSRSAFEATCSDSCVEALAEPRPPAPSPEHLSCLIQASGRAPQACAGLGWVSKRHSRAPLCLHCEWAVLLATRAVICCAVATHFPLLVASLSRSDFTPYQNSPDQARLDQARAGLSDNKYTPFDAIVR